MKKIILASASPRRRELLKQAGFSFEVMESDAEEVTDKTAPDEVVKELSSIKAKSVLGLVQGDALVIGADTIVALDGRILGKPKDRADAAKMLSGLSGRTHQVYTGVSLFFRTGETVESKSFCEETDVAMYPIEPAEIEWYLNSGEPFDKAGAYGIQGKPLFL